MEDESEEKAYNQYSFMSYDNQSNFNKAMSKMCAYIFSFRQDFPEFVALPEHYMKSLKPFAEEFEKCKEYCRNSGNNDWDTWLADWELLVTHLYKYEEYVKNNGYVQFNDYLKEIGVKIFIDK